MTKFYLKLLISFFLSASSVVQAKQISVFFGYIDQHPTDFVIDAQEAQILVSVLTTDCEDREVVCGFSEDSQHENSFVKGSIRINLYHSSITNSDLTNRTEYLSQQLQQSQFVKNQFISALNSSGDVLYVGHSRYGYGPDFSMAILNQGVFDKAQYLKRIPERLTEIQSWLSSSQARSLTLISCSSQSHFSSLSRLKSKTKLQLVDSVLQPSQARDYLKKTLRQIILN